MEDLKEIPKITAPSYEVMKSQAMYAQAIAINNVALAVNNLAQSLTENETGAFLRVLKSKIKDDM